VGPAQVNPSSDAPDTSSTSPVDALAFDVTNDGQMKPLEPPHMTNSIDTALTATNGSQSPEALQTVFNQALSNPAQLQRLLAALGSQPFPYSNYDAQSSSPATESQLAPFAPHYDLARNFPPSSNFSPFPQPSALPTIFEDSHLEPLVASSNHLHQAYKDATDVNKDVDALHSSLNSLIESIGLDPAMLNAPNPANSVPTTQDNVQVPHEPVSMTPDYDFDSLWSQITTDGATDLPHDFTVGQGTAEDLLERSLTDAATEHFAFLDDAVSSSGPIMPQTTLPNENSPAQGGNRKKRKSDASETESSKTNSNTAQALGESTTPRAKRKR
jgi:heat shock transcription factor